MKSELERLISVSVRGIHVHNTRIRSLIAICTGAGVESMTMGYGAGVMPEKMSEKVLSNQESADCLIPMGITSENVAAQYGISRDVQDTFAASSYAKAYTAQKDGKFRSEIVPVKVCRDM
jgi:acetyl-CoA acyltransferase 1